MKRRINDIRKAEERPELELRGFRGGIQLRIPFHVLHVLVILLGDIRSERRAHDDLVSTKMIYSYAHAKALVGWSGGL